MLLVIHISLTVSEGYIWCAEYGGEGEEFMADTVCQSMGQNGLQI